jgi:hypothetical protein
LCFTTPARKSIVQSAFAQTKVAAIVTGLITRLSRSKTNACWAVDTETADYRFGTRFAPSTVQFACQEKDSMKKSVQKTAGSNRVPGKHTATKRAWFPRGDGVGDRDTFETYCDKHGLTPVRTFESWNDNEGHIALALTSKQEVVLCDGEKRWSFTPPEAMEFMADMRSDSEAGDHFYGETDFYLLIAAALKGGAK